MARVEQAVDDDLPASPEDGRHVALRGWVKLWRRILVHPLFEALTDRQRNVAITVLLMANWEDRPWLSTSLGREVVIPRGGFVSSELGIARAANTSRKVVRLALQRLTGGGFLQVRRLGGCAEGDSVSVQTARRSRGRVSLYLVTNYERWQGRGQEGASTGATSGPQQGPDLRRSRSKEKREEGPSPSGSSPGPEHSSGSSPGPEHLSWETRHLIENVLARRSDAGRAAPEKLGREATELHAVAQADERSFSAAALWLLQKEDFDWTGSPVACLRRVMLKMNPKKRQDSTAHEARDE